MANQKSAGNGQASSMLVAPAPTALAHDGAGVLDQMASFIRRYLVCDDHQLAILTLWSACTQCHGHFFAAPYLHVRSPQAHSGRSLCLNILCSLSDADTVFIGVPAAPLLDRLIQGRSLDRIDTSAPLSPFPILLDDCHHSFGLSERQPLVSLLASGSERIGFFPWGDDDYYLFGPKAFAGNSPLPKSLAARCIPIHLRRPKPSEKFISYWSRDDSEDVNTLRGHLRRWLNQVSSALAQAAKNRPSDLPPTLSPGQNKWAEALVHIADVAGGSWPAKVRAALAAVFDLAEAAPELQILSDLRVIFHEKNNPEYLATSDLLSLLRSLDNRPWSGWSSKSGRRLAGHLHGFGIVSRRLHFGSANDFMGYLFKDFHDAWERYLPPLSSSAEPERIEIFSNGNVPPRRIAGDELVRISA